MNESVLKTLTVAFVVCLVCSLVVSSTAVSLRDMQNKNKLNDERMKILQSANMFDPSVSIESQFNQLEIKFVDFNTGKILNNYKDFDIQNYDQIAATRDSNLSTKIPTSEDIAIIKKTTSAENGKIAAVLTLDNEITLKKIKMTNQKIYLIPANKAYDIKEHNIGEVQIQGTLSGIIRKYN